MSALGSLVVSLALDNYKFVDGLKKSEHLAKKSTDAIASGNKGVGKTFDDLYGRVDKFAGRMEAMSHVGVALAAAWGGLRFVGGVMDEFDRIGALADRFGTSAETLQALGDAAEQSDTDMATLAGGLQKLTTRMYEAVHGDKELAREFKALGIDASKFVDSSDGAEQALYTLSDRIAAARSPAEALTIATRALGKSAGPELIPLLSKGGAALRGMADEARNTGRVLDGETLKQIKEFNDHAAALSRTFKVGMVGMAGPFITEFNKMMDEVERRKSSWEKFLLIIGSPVLATANALGAGIGITPLERAKQQQESLFAELRDAQAKLTSLRTQDAAGGLGGLLVTDDDLARNERYVASVKGRLQEATQLYQKLAKAEADAARAGQNKPTAKPFTLPGDATKPKRMSATEWAMEESAHLTRTYYQIQQEASEEYTAQLRNEFDAEWALIELQDDQYRAGRDAAARWTEALDPMQKYRDDLEEIARLEREGYLTADKALAAQFLVHEQMDKALAANNEALKEQNDIARELGLTFTSAFEDAMVSGKKFGQVMAGVAQDLYRLFLRKTVSEPAMGWFSSTLAGSGLGNLFGNWFSSGGGASNLSAFSSMDFGSISAFSTAFARGGIMTDRGPLPLNAYAGGGIADRPQLAVFGEGRRPEAYVPLPDGRSIPVTMQGGGGVTIVQNFDFRNATAEAEAKLRAEAGRIKRETLATLMDNLNRGGAFAQATGRI